MKPLCSKTAETNQTTHHWVPASIVDGLDFKDLIYLNAYDETLALTAPWQELCSVASQRRLLMTQIPSVCQTAFRLLITALTACPVSLPPIKSQCLTLSHCHQCDWKKLMAFVMVFFLLSHKLQFPARKNLKRHRTFSPSALWRIYLTFKLRWLNAHHVRPQQIWFLLLHYNDQEL